MYHCLDGVRAVNLSVCDRMTAEAPSTLSTIITSRYTHINIHAHTQSNNAKIGHCREILWFIQENLACICALYNRKKNLHGEKDRKLIYNLRSKTHPA